MAQKNAYYCDLCGQNINDATPHDFVFYMVAGNVNGRDTVDVTDLDLPDHLKLLLLQKTHRLELCVNCVGGEISFGPQAKGKMLGHLLGREKAAARRRGGKDGETLAKAQEEFIRGKFPDVEPIEPAGEW